MVPPLRHPDRLRAGGQSLAPGSGRLRRAAATCALLTAVLLAAGAPGAQATGRRSPGLTVRIHPDHRLGHFRRGAVGLSIEASQLSSEVIGPGQRSLVGLMRGLGPATLRVGGNSADRSWWTADGEPSPSWATDTITPQDLERLRGLLDATGWKTVLTLNLGHFDPQRAAGEAAAAADILGPRLQAIEIGNEPNGFGNSVKRLRPHTYGVDDYLRELSQYRAYVDAAAPGLPLAGPDLSFAPSSRRWLPVIASQRPMPFAEITHHWYPTAYNEPDPRCKPTPVPRARDLLTPSVRDREDAVLAEVTAVGEAADRPTGISETNTTSSCNAAGGPDTSPVFASALWALDWTLRAAQAGVSSVDFHGNVTRCAPFGFSPICTPDKPGAASLARPEYYGLLAAAGLEGGRFVPVKLSGRRTAEHDFTAYATKHGDGTVTLAVVDLLPRGHTRVAVSAPGYAPVSTRLLSAPSIDSRKDARLGRATRGELPLVCRAGSAQIVTLRPRRG